jgi:hypothetical protein
MIKQMEVIGTGDLDIVFDKPDLAQTENLLSYNTTSNSESSSFTLNATFLSDTLSSLKLDP